MISYDNPAQNRGVSRYHREDARFGSCPAAEVIGFQEKT